MSAGFFPGDEDYYRDRDIAKFARFMPIAHATAAMSKYPGTKVGALVLGPDFEQRSGGWNGAPRGSTADTDGRLAERTTRVRFAVHAEANAIANAARHGASLLGCTMVVTMTPCLECAKLIIQAGITRVIAKRSSDTRWALDEARALFDECGVELIEI